jgi:hypothetical protein
MECTQNGTACICAICVRRGWWFRMHGKYRKLYLRYLRRPAALKIVSTSRACQAWGARRHAPPTYRMPCMEAAQQRDPNTSYRQIRSHSPTASNASEAGVAARVHACTPGRAARVHRSGAALRMISSRTVSPRASWRGCWPHFGFGRERFGRCRAVHKLEVSRAITAHSSKRRGSHIARTAHRHNRAISGICTERRPSHAASAKIRRTGRTDRRRASPLIRSFGRGETIYDPVALRAGACPQGGRSAARISASKRASQRMSSSVGPPLGNSLRSAHATCFGSACIPCAMRLTS